MGLAAALGLAGVFLVVVTGVVFFFGVALAKGEAALNDSSLASSSSPSETESESDSLYLNRHK